MRDDGILSIYKLENTAPPGYPPQEQKVLVCTAYYSEQRVGVTRAYLAAGAQQQIDLLVRCWNTPELETAAEYAEVNGEQYRITLKQKVIDEDAIDLTLVRLGENQYDVNTKA